MSFLLALLAAAPALAGGWAPGLAEVVAIEVAGGPAAELVAAAEGREATVRARAALALGRLGGEDALPALAPFLRDPEPAVRARAAFAAGLLPGSVEALRAALVQEPAPTVRGALLAALGRRGGPEDVPLLVAGLSGPVPEARGAAEGLGRMARRQVSGLDVPEVLSALAARLQALDPDLRVAAAFALGAIRPAHPDAPTARRITRALLRDPEPGVRALLVRALPDLAPRAARDVEPHVRAAAARALPHAPDPLPTAELLLADPDPGVRETAARAVGALLAEGAVEPEAVAGSLRRLLDDPDPAVAAAAVGAGLGVLDGLTPRAVLVSGAAPRVRAEAVAALDRVPQLVRIALEDPEPVLRTAAAGRLLDLDDPTAAAPLLEASDPKVEAVGCTLAAAHPGAVDPQRIQAALAAPSGADPDVATACWEALLAGSGSGPGDDALLPLALRGRALPVAALQPLLDRAAERFGWSSLPPAPSPDPPDPDVLADLRVARILTELGEVRVELWPGIAPLAVWHFAELAASGFYDGLTFHRVVPGFVAQAGCPRGDGWGDAGFTLPDAFSDAPFDRGVLGLASAGPGTAGSQWFLVLEPHPHLDGDYTAFGRLTVESGVLDRIRPGTRIRTITIDRIPDRP